MNVRCSKLLPLFLLMVIPALGQTPVTVTGTITDAGGNVATSGYVQFDIQPKVSSIQYFVSGVGTIAPQSVQCPISGTGTISCNVWGNDVISPANTQYKVTFAPGGNIANVVNGECITGSNYNLNSPLFCPVVQVNPQQAIVRANPFATNIVPITDATFTIGFPLLRYANGYFANLTVNGSGVPTVAGNNTWTGISTFVGFSIFDNFDNRIQLGHVYPCTSAGVNAALAALPNPAGIIDGLGCPGSLSPGGTITINKQATVQLAGVWQFSTCPAVDLTSEGATLMGLQMGGPTGANPPSVIQAVSGCSGPIVRYNISAGVKGGYVHDLKIDGNSVSTVTFGLYDAPNQIEVNTAERVVITGVNQPGSACLGFGGNDQDFWSEHLNMQLCSRIIDLGTANNRHITIRDSRGSCTFSDWCVVLGTDDNVSGNRSHSLRLENDDFEASGGTVPGVVSFRNCGACSINEGWYESGGAMTTLLVLGDGSSTPLAPYIGGGVMLQGDGVVNYAIEFNSVLFPTVKGAFGINFLTKMIKNTSGVSVGSVEGIYPGSPAGACIDNTLGLVESYCNSTSIANAVTFGYGIISNTYTSTSTNIATTGQIRLGAADTISWNTGNFALGINGSSQLTWPNQFISAGLVAGGTAATLTGTGACATITTQHGGAWAGDAKCTGTTGASTLTITPGSTAPNGWICNVQDETTRANLFQQTSHTTAACVLTITSVTQNDVFAFSALSY